MGFLLINFHFQSFFNSSFLSHILMGWDRKRSITDNIPQRVMTTLRIFDSVMHEHPGLHLIVAHPSINGPAVGAMVDEDMRKSAL